MNIIVCVKQTPEAGKGEMDPKNGRVRRTGERQMINPFDLYAMEAALRLQEEVPDTRIIALSMGQQSAASVLRDCIALGAETGYLVNDPAFAGSDVRGTARILAGAVRVIEKREGIRADAVFCGAKSVDGGTSMLGPELAGILGIPQVTYALHCSFQDRKDAEAKQAAQGNRDAEAKQAAQGNRDAETRQAVQGNQDAETWQAAPGGQDAEEGQTVSDSQNTVLRVEKEDDRGNRIYHVPTPCLLTFTKASFQVRYPMIARILMAEGMELPVLSAGDIQSGDSADRKSLHAGAAGAAAEVLDVQLRKLEKQSQIIEDPDPVKAVTALAQRLFSEGIL